MKESWKAYYYDGKTAQRHDASIALSPRALTITWEGGSALWPLEEVTQTQGFSPGEPVRLERGEEALILREEGLVEALNGLSGFTAGSRGRFRGPRSGKGYALIVSVAFVLAVAFGAGLYFWGIPLASAVAAEKVPPSVEERLGDTVVKGLTDAIPECGSPEVTVSIEEIVKRLDGAAAPHPYEFRVHILKSDMVNALAAPGGHIVVFSGLLKETGRPEELAGVLSHEMQHVLRKHATKGIFEEASTGILLSLAFGNFEGLSGAAATLGTLRYSRIHEEEADKLGAELLVRAGIDPLGMVDFFESLGKKEPSSGDVDYLKYLSTHPLTGERIDYIKKHVEGRHTESRPLLPEVDWEAIKRSCG